MGLSLNGVAKETVGNWWKNRGPKRHVVKACEWRQVPRQRRRGTCEPPRGLTPMLWNLLTSGHP